MGKKEFRNTGGCLVDTIVKGEIYCPYCKSTKIIVFENAKGRCSLQCSNCKRFYIADYDKMKSERGEAIKSDQIRIATAV